MILVIFQFQKLLVKSIIMEKNDTLTNRLRINV